MRHNGRGAVHPFAWMSPRLSATWRGMTSRPRSPFCEIVVPAILRSGGTPTTFSPMRHIRTRPVFLTTSTPSNATLYDRWIMLLLSDVWLEGPKGAGCAARQYVRGSRARA